MQSKSRNVTYAIGQNYIFGLWRPAKKLFESKFKSHDTKHGVCFSRILMKCACLSCQMCNATVLGKLMLIVTTMTEPLHFYYFLPLHLT